MKILVIGMGPGVGLATARRFGREGFEVVMVARKAQKLQEFQDQLTAENIRSTAYPADIADAAAFQQVLEQIARDQIHMLGADTAVTLPRSSYHRVAEGYGAAGEQVDTVAAFRAAVLRAIESMDRGVPYLINAMIGSTPFRQGSISM
jgi:NAD(P)-dependent dehydrogenase (short-subunit alcohol dehydrogenase family)